MHLTVTHWKSLVPVAQKSEVSEITGSVPLKIGGKKNQSMCCVCADTHFTIKHFNSVPYSYDPAMLLPKVHTTYEHGKNLKKTNSSCNTSVVFTSPICGFAGILMKIKCNFFIFTYNSCVPRAPNLPYEL